MCKIKRFFIILFTFIGTKLDNNKCEKCCTELENIQLLDVAKRRNHKSMSKCNSCKIIYTIDEKNELIDTRMSFTDYKEEKARDDIFSNAITLCSFCENYTVMLGKGVGSGEWIYGCKQCNVLYSYKAESFTGKFISFTRMVNGDYEKYVSNLKK